MARNTGDFFDVPGAFGGDDLPDADRRLTNPNTRREPVHQPMLSADKIHPAAAGKGQVDIDGGHDTDISPTQNQSQDPNIENADESLSHTDSMALGDLIRQARQRLGLRQIDLARRLRVKQSAISQWESGKFTPELENRMALAAELHIALQDIMPEAGSIPAEAFNDPQIRRLVENFLALDPQQRSMLDILVLQLRERNERDPQALPPPTSPPRARRRRGR